jgi:hypothetical protein
MKRIIVASLVTFVFLVVIAAWLPVSVFYCPEAYAGGKKISGTGKVTAIVSETRIYPGDNRSHFLTLSNYLELDSSADPLFNDVQVNEVVAADNREGAGTMRGYRVSTHPGGGKTFMAIEGMTKTIMEQGSPPKRTFGGKWWYTGGTGKLKGITGGGTFEGKITRAGVTYEWEGEYELK